MTEFIFAGIVLWAVILYVALVVASFLLSERRGRP